MNERHLTESDGITMTKYVDVDDPDDVRVGFQIESSRSDPVVVRIVDPVSDVTDVRVPDTDPDYWDAGERGIEYERTIQPAETITTMYRHACDDPERLEEDHPEPTLVVDAPATDAGTRYATGDDDFEMPGDEMAIAELTSESATHPPDDPGPRTGTVPHSRGDGAGAARTGDVLEALIRALEDDATPTQQERLRRALADTVRPRSSLEAQVRRLQSRFEEFASYVDSLEAFLNGNGTGEELLDDLSEGIADVRADLASLADAHDDVDTRLADVETRLEEFESAVDARQDAIGEDVRALERSLETVERDLETVADDLETAEDERAEFDEQLADLAEFQESVREAFRESATTPT